MLELFHRYKDWTENYLKSSQCPKKGTERKLEELLLKTLLKITTTSCSLEPKHKGMKDGSGLLHSSVAVHEAHDEPEQ